MEAVVNLGWEEFRSIHQYRDILWEFATKVMEASGGEVWIICGMGNTDGNMKMTIGSSEHLGLIASFYISCREL